MAYFKDLSEYSYTKFGPGNNIGWLARGHAFPTMTPKEELLDVLWLYCSISVAQTRGGHDCEFCPAGSARYFERNGQRLKLGTSEIRVFSRSGQIYTAPTLIYHYVAVHHYNAPDEFLRALWDGPRPPSKEYFDALAGLNLEWNKTSKGAPRDRVVFYEYTGQDGRNYLDKTGTLNSITSANLSLEEGLRVRFYRPDFRPSKDGKDEEDYLLFEGTVHFDPEKKQWYAIIDEKSYQRESDLYRTDGSPSLQIAKG